MSMKSNLAELMLMAAIMGDSYGLPVLDPESIDVTKKKKVIPKGCKEYFFNINGGYSYNRNEHTIFDCIAMNPVKARNKFEKWKSYQL